MPRGKKVFYLCFEHIEGNRPFDIDENLPDPEEAHGHGRDDGAVGVRGRRPVASEPVTAHPGVTAAIVGVGEHGIGPGGLRVAPALRRDPGAGWVGHAEDYVVVRAGVGDGRSLAGEIAIVRVDGTDPADPERAVGQIEHVVARPDAGRALPVVPLPA
jgi:hypothetical protein